MRISSAIATALFLIASHPALAQKNNITCTGILIDIDLKPRADFPLAVIYDATGGYTCLIDRSGSGHDPLRPCEAGRKCRVVGAFSRKVGQTYTIRTLVSVDQVE
jgi:hypothetical protein